MDHPVPDSAQVVASTALPCVIPFDVIYGSFRPIFTAGTLYAFISRFYVHHHVRPMEWLSIGVCLAAALYLQFLAFRVAIDDSGIFFTNSFGVRAREIPWSAIRKIRTGTGKLRMYGAEIEGSLRDVKGRGYLIVLDRNDGKPQALINIKPLSMKGVTTLAHFLIDKARGAEIDDATRRLARGIVPAYFTRSREQKGYG